METEDYKQWVSEVIELIDFIMDQIPKGYDVSEMLDELANQFRDRGFKGLVTELGSIKYWYNEIKEDQGLTIGIVGWRRILSLLNNLKFGFETDPEKDEKNFYTDEGNPVEISRPDRHKFLLNKWKTSRTAGMMDNMSSDTDYEAILHSYFTTVSPYWESGNFKGYAASDSPQMVSSFVAAMGSWERSRALNATSANEFQKFFEDATGGQHAPKQQLNYGNDPVLNTYAEHAGNFDQHIETSIPGFRDNFSNKVKAILAVLPNGGRVLDIAASEGSFGKTVSAMSGGKIQTVSLDPNQAMAQFFQQKSQVPGASYATEAFGQGYVDDDGTTYNSHQPQQLYDIVHESMGFQFIGPDRKQQVAQAKALLKPGGLFLSEQKFLTQNFDENEVIKDQWKQQYYNPEDLARKQQQVKFQKRLAWQIEASLEDEYQLDMIESDFASEHQLDIVDPNNQKLIARITWDELYSWDEKSDGTHIKYLGFVDDWTGRAAKPNSSALRILQKRYPRLGQQMLMWVKQNLLPPYEADYENKKLKGVAEKWQQRNSNWQIEAKHIEVTVEEGPYPGGTEIEFWANDGSAMGGIRAGHMSVSRIPSGGTYVTGISVAPQFRTTDLLQQMFRYLDTHYEGPFDAAFANKRLFDVINKRYPGKIHPDAEVKDEGRWRPISKTARKWGWQDYVAPKAKRMKDEGKVTLLRNGAEHIVAQVVGDHKTYQVEIDRVDPNSMAISGWSCECPWYHFAFGRTLKWKKYEGRMCSHAMATFWQSQATPLDDEAQEPSAPFEGAPMPGASPGSPVVGPHPDVPTESVLVPPDAEVPPGTIAIPGTFSKMRTAIDQYKALIK